MSNDGACDHSNANQQNEILSPANSSLQITAQSNFAQHLESASVIVRTWPEWKRRILGRITYRNVGRRDSGEIVD